MVHYLASANMLAYVTKDQSQPSSQDLTHMIG